MNHEHPVIIVQIATFPVHPYKQIEDGRLVLNDEQPTVKSEHYRQVLIVPRAGDWLQINADLYLVRRVVLPTASPDHGLIRVPMVMVQLEREVVG